MDGRWEITLDRRRVWTEEFEPRLCYARDTSPSSLFHRSTLISNPYRTTKEKTDKANPATRHHEQQTDTRQGQDKTRPPILTATSRMSTMTTHSKTEPTTTDDQHDDHQAPPPTRTPPGRPMRKIFSELAYLLKLVWSDNLLEGWEITPAPGAVISLKDVPGHYEWI